MGDLVEPVELCHRRLVIFSVAVTLALSLEVGYAQVVPKLPQLYGVLLRAAVWDCVLVGVFVAQATDLMSTPLVAGTDGSHFFPLTVLLYHVLCFLLCAGTDLCARARSVRGRSWHRSLVLRRALLELAGGSSGSRLALGRVCFMVSGGAMWLALRALLWIGSGTWTLCAFIITLFGAYGAAGFAALEPRHTLPGHLVQWLCTGWGLREAIIHGPLKLVGALLLLPFAASVIAAQIWLRAVVFVVWITVACPCCRLRRSDDVYDAFGREVAVPLLQCSLLAFSCTLSAICLSATNGQLAGAQYMASCIAAIYYTGMLLLWTAPMVLNAKVAFEESFDLNPRLSDYGGDESQTVPLRGEGRSNSDMEGVELEDLRATCEELRALLHRERHDHSIEVMQLQDKMRDAELRTRLAQRSSQEVEKERTLVEEALGHAQDEVEEWRLRCDELGMQLDKVLRPQPTGERQHSAPSQSPGRATVTPAPPAQVAGPETQEVKSFTGKESQRASSEEREAQNTSLANGADGTSRQVETAATAVSVASGQHTHSADESSIATNVATADPESTNSTTGESDPAPVQVHVPPPPPPAPPQSVAAEVADEEETVESSTSTSAVAAAPATSADEQEVSTAEAMEATAPDEEAPQTDSPLEARDEERDDEAPSPRMSPAGDEADAQDKEAEEGVSPESNVGLQDEAESAEEAGLQEEDLHEESGQEVSAVASSAAETQATSEQHRLGDDCAVDPSRAQDTDTDPEDGAGSEAFFDTEVDAL